MSEITKVYNADEILELIEYLGVLIKFYEVAGLPEEADKVRVIKNRFLSVTT